MAAGVTFCLNLHVVVGLFDGDVRIDFLFSTCLVATTSRAIGLFHGARLLIHGDMNSLRVFFSGFLEIFHQPGRRHLIPPTAAAAAVPTVTEIIIQRISLTHQGYC